MAGLGRAGLSACRALAARDGADQVRGWASEIPPPLAGAVEQLRGAGVRIETGGDGVEFLRAGPAPRCLVKSPGIPPWAPLLTSAAEAGVVIMDELELGWRLSTAPLIAVTGTNGKSTTAHLIAAVLEAAGTRVALAGNTHFGPPLSGVPGHAEVIVCEVSSFQLEGCLELLPEVGVFTNLTHDHLYRHASVEAYAASKRALFVRAGRATALAIVNTGDRFGASLASEVRDAGGRVVGYGGPGAEFRYESTDLGLESSALAVRTSEAELRFQTRLAGAHNAANAVAALATCVSIGVDPGLATRTIGASTPVPGRLEPVAGGQPFDVVVDYAHNPDGIRAALRTARNIVERRGEGQVRAVLSALAFIGLPQRRAMGAAAAQLADHLILTTERWTPDASLEPPAGLVQGAAEVAAARWEVVSGRHRAIESAVRAARPGDIVMILGRGAQADELFEPGRDGSFDDRAVAREALRCIGGNGASGAAAYQAARVAGPTIAYERDSTVTEVFESRVDEQRGAIAVDFEGSTLTYGELDEQGNRLAHRLRAAGVGRETPVGIYLERSLEMVIALVAVLKAGGTYVGLDVSAPPERVRTVMDDAGLCLVCTHTRLRPRIPAGPGALCLDELDLTAEPGSRPEAVARPTDAAYIGYTSGSTGRPKGAAIPHRGVLRLVRGQDYLDLGPQETLLAVANPMFDLSTLEVWGALLNGARLAVFPPDPPLPDVLDEVARRQRVTTLQLTPAVFNRLVDRGAEVVEQVRQLVVGGDVLSPEHAGRALKAMRRDGVLINAYGPTEVTTYNTCHRMPARTRVTGPIPIGRPMANTHVYVLDEQGRGVPDGSPGELYIGGDGIASGYVGAPGLTAERFVADPHPTEPGGRMYRSGDRVRLGPDGSLEFLGRVDRQVQVRGFRVEPAEVEHALAGHPAVREIVVEPRAYGPNDTRLIAYVVPTDGTRLDPGQLRAFASERLPAYEVPSAWVALADLPLTARGKFDRAALPAPTRANLSDPARRPRDELEQALVAIWEDVLDVRPVTPGDDFFALGGHSLLAAELFLEMNAELGIRLPLAAIFEAPTVEKLARVIRADGWTPHWDSLVTLRSEGSRPPLFCAGAGEGHAVGYGALANRLGPEQPFYALQPRGLDGRRPFALRVEEMAADYVREVRRVSPRGPYLLAGRCLGTKVALEMGRQLIASGEEVALLAVLDDVDGPLGFDARLTNGVRWDDMLSLVRERARVEGVELGNVFTPEGTAALLEYALARVTGTAEVGVPRYLYEAWLRFPEVRAAYPDLEGRGAAELVNWGWTTGRRDPGMPAELLPAPVNMRAPRLWWPWSAQSRRAQSALWRARAGARDRVDVAARRAGAGRRRRRAVSLHDVVRRANAEYRARPYPGTITHIASEERARTRTPRRWRDIALEGTEEHVVPGSHRTILREPEVAGLAACLAGCIDRAIGAREVDRAIGAREDTPSTAG